MSVELALAIIGTITGLSSLLVHVIKSILLDRPRLKVGDALVSLQKKGKRLEAEFSFNINNTGDRATTIVRTIVILGPDVEVIEGLKTLPAHSSIRIPEKQDSSLTFRFPEEVEFTNGTRRRYFEQQEKLEIIVHHTHETLKKSYCLPPSSDWEKQALYEGGPILLDLR